MSDQNEPQEKKEASFLPFHALNQFMVNEFRLGVVRTALFALPKLDKSFRAPIDRLTRKVVKVHGFRNSAKAPARVKVRPMADAFETSPKLVAAILAAWGEAKAELRQQVYDLLAACGWETLPPEADRTKLPGFLTRWPAEQDFEVLIAAFREAHPDLEVEDDDISLMIVWVSGRLPVDMVETEPENDEEEQEAEES